MELQDLNHAERLVSVAILDLIVTADGVGSPAEATHAARLAEAFGEEEYQQLLVEAGQIHQTEDEFKELVAEVRKQDARDLIYGEVMDCAMEDGVEHTESEFLDWLAEEWNVQIEMVDHDEE